MSTEQKVHSKLGASKYEQWKACPGSVRLCEGIPNVSSVYAEEGSLAHSVGEAILRGQPLPVPETELPYDMLEAVQVYVDYVESLLAKRPSFSAIEERFHLKDLHPDLFGTADFVCYYSRVKELHVVDYKHGKGVPVEVMEDGAPNKQLMYYGLGALSKLKLPIDKVVLTIVQPRCYHKDGPIRSCTIDSVDMVEFGFELVEDAKKTEDPNAPLVAGEQCRWCPAASTCPALKRQVVETAFIDETEAAVLPAVIPHHIAPEVLAHYLTMIPRIEAWCSAINKHAHAQAEAGVKVPGFKLVDKVARRKWADEVNEDVLWKEFRLDRDVACDISIKSPKTIETLLKKTLPKEKVKDALFVLDQYVVKESSGKTLVPANDDRAAVAGKIETMFNQE